MGSTLDSEDIEIVLVDNGSTQELDLGDLKKEIKFYNYPNPTKSPAAAINFGINKASSELIGVFIDGARQLYCKSRCYC